MPGVCDYQTLVIAAKRVAAPVAPAAGRKAIYRLIVPQLIRRAFRHLSAGDYGCAVATFAPATSFCFAGDHALGGELRGPEEGWRLNA